jgi:flavodoxin I
MFRFDSSNPHYLIIYTGDEHAVPADYQAIAEHWVAQMDRGERFGVIVVNEPHEHHEDDDEEEMRQNEAEITRITNDFRRDYRERTSQINLGFARVFTLEFKKQYYDADPEAWDRGVEQNNTYAQYNWGIPGGVFLSLEDAQTWVLELLKSEPVPAIVEAPATEIAPTKIGLFYGSSTGITEYVSEDIEDAWKKAGMEPISAINIMKLKNAADLLQYDCLILGIPTWNIGQLQDDWEILMPELEKLDFSGKKIALFGVGDQINYADNFLDAVGILGEKLIERGGELVGYWMDDDYDFDDSLAFVDGKFMGLGIDETNQPKLTNDRIEAWVAQIIGEFALQASVAS